jgi:Ca2+-binding EF-hand superfamily protein
MKKLLTLFSVALLLPLLSGIAYAGKDAEHCDSDKKKSYMQKLDTNADGNVSREEFLANAEARFAKLDANGDGAIQKEEFKKKHKDMKEKRMEMKKSKESAE